MNRRKRKQEERFHQQWEARFGIPTEPPRLTPEKIEFLYEEARRRQREEVHRRQSIAQISGIAACGILFVGIGLKLFQPGILPDIPQGVVVAECSFPDAEPLVCAIYEEEQTEHRTMSVVAKVRTTRPSKPSHITTICCNHACDSAYIATVTGECIDYFNNVWA